MQGSRAVEWSTEGLLVWGGWKYPRSRTKEVSVPRAFHSLPCWGVNFYYPTYVKIGRALAERDYTWRKWSDPAMLHLAQPGIAVRTGRGV